MHVQFRCDFLRILGEQRRKRGEEREKINGVLLR